MARILIVEDNTEIHDMEKELLTKSGYSVVSAFSGTEALFVLEKEQIDLIVLDLMLPGMAGDEVLEKVRISYDAAVLCVTAVDSVESKIKLLKLGADDYLVKPFNYEEFVVRIEALLRRVGKTGKVTESASGSLGARDGGEKTDMIVFRDVEINPLSREVRAGGKPADLTRKEYEILELMMRYPGKVFTRENIFETVWGEESLPEDNSVNVHIGNLRKKLAAAGGRDDYIKTVWGIGFKMSEES